MARPQAKLDPEALEKLCSLQCTDEEIAAFFGVSAKTIQRRKSVPAFAQRMESGRAKGRISLRRAQMRLVEGGNATMCIWLGKQLLGQRDHLNATTDDRLDEVLELIKNGPVPAAPIEIQPAESAGRSSDPAGPEA